MLFACFRNSNHLLFNKILYYEKVNDDAGVGRFLPDSFRK